MVIRENIPRINDLGPTVKMQTHQSSLRTFLYAEVMSQFRIPLVLAREETE